MPEPVLTPIDYVSWEALQAVAALRLAPDDVRRIVDQIHSLRVAHMWLRPASRKSLLNLQLAFIAIPESLRRGSLRRVLTLRHLYGVDCIVALLVSRRLAHRVHRHMKEITSIVAR